MNMFKGALRSKAIWGSLLSMGAMIFDISAGDQEAIVEVLTKAVEVVGAGVAIYGRVVANSRIGSFL